MIKLYFTLLELSCLMRFESYLNFFISLFSKCSYELRNVTLSKVCSDLNFILKKANYRSFFTDFIVYLIS